MKLQKQLTVPIKTLSSLPTLTFMLTALSLGQHSVEFIMKQSPSHKKKMRDIAELAGVSPSTVSRALSGSPLVNEKTRNKIQALAKEHNYVINKQAQNLRLQSSKTISVMIPIDHEPRQHVSDPFFLEILGSIADRLTESGYDLLLSRIFADQWMEHMMSNHYLDGIIVIGQSVLHDKLNAFAEQALLPMVVWGAQLEDQKYQSVGSDNFRGGYIAGQHLVNIGRKNLGFIGDIALPEVRLRYNGFLKALNEAALPPPGLLHSTFTQQSANDAMRRAIDAGFNHDGLFAASDVLASCAIKSLSAASLSVPDQVSIVGYDNISLAEFMSPAVTTISQQIDKGGAALVDSLFALGRGEQPQNVLLMPELVVRET